MAWVLAERGWQVRVLEAGAHPGHGASGNPAAILYPKLVSAELTPEHLQSIAYLRALQYLKDERLNAYFHQTGVLWLSDGKQPSLDTSHPWWQKQFWPLTPEQASVRAGINLKVPALWLPEAGVIVPAGLLCALLTHPRITLQCDTELEHAEAAGDLWQLHLRTRVKRCIDQREVDASELDSKALEIADVLVIANAGAAKHLSLTKDLPLRPVRGQISQLSACLPLRTTLCFGGYITPALPLARTSKASITHATGTMTNHLSGTDLVALEHCLGATFQPDRDDISSTEADQHANRIRLLRLLPDLSPLLPNTVQWKARASLRWQTPDYLPLVGRLPNLAKLRISLNQTASGRRPPPTDLDSPPVFVSLGHGSKGFTQAWVAADIIANDLDASLAPEQRRERQQALRQPALSAECTQPIEPILLPATLIDKLRPERFLQRDWRRGRLD